MEQFICRHNLLANQWAHIMSITDIL